MVVLKYPTYTSIQSSSGFIKAYIFYKLILFKWVVVFVMVIYCDSCLNSCCISQKCEEKNIVTFAGQPPCWKIISHCSCSIKHEAHILVVLIKIWTDHCLILSCIRITNRTDWPSHRVSVCGLTSGGELCLRLYYLSWPVVGDLQLNCPLFKKRKPAALQKQM